VSLAVRLEHHLPVGLQVAGLITPTEFGDLASAAV